ncbi:MAG: polyamine ABC transporter ATP-binding protein [Mesorhizobium sp.]|uniref:ABC transporter ATP-binding protein n=2 Tax=Mesorhizobium TaxID=68287 RepID=UPI000F756B06|nr:MULTISPECIES: ABC transporter ATP-binding protein [unclassified Mesorhizobium]RVC70872.1 polyamine ABC transporter ATP-binding protein [Mesorhizobium sp. M00.F.Ca.ET.038.03.1.1]RVC82645.1 polyamine ABC transporter ATP-binding protein [Mesorhizobium sp. M2A.F.Ca.ET.046.02.1.1]AZO34734.1 ABC transporter ATP-binding protein [Mesorhizobium sp. M2A.F.Ca.ET.046.03.2.1]RWE22299.1 MAG: polyamine ABC transporter ATP-binding protein [Mesorhizobium sp.]RWF06314.1 MAG: polyamine ABC transporter ATP-bin
MLQRISESHRDDTLPPQTNVVVRFENVSKAYDRDNIIIRGLTLDIERGEFLTLLGPSGSGKSTSLMMLAGFEAPSAGRIYLNGRPIENLPAHKRNIGMVFQNYALFPHMTVAENLAYPLRVRRLAKGVITQRVNRALDMVQMRDFAERKPALLSGGQQQRVALARAIVFQPELILMDEPLGALDKRLREDLQLEIKHLHQELGVSIVYVTHDQSEALTMSDRIAIFNCGRIEQLDKPGALYDAPQTRFVAGFIGDNNAIEGEVIAVRDGLATLIIDHGISTQARAATGLAKGQRAIISIRPEKISLRAAGNSSAAQLTARIRDRIYLGDHFQFHAQTDAGTGLLVKQLNVAEGLGLNPGDRCELTWAAEDCIAFCA